MAASISSSICRKVLNSASKKVLPGSRPFHTTGTKQMGGGGDHAAHDNYDDYLHAEHMYNLPAMKNRTLKMGLAVFAVVGIGTAVPIVAVIFQQKKAKIM